MEQLQDMSCRGRSATLILIASQWPDASITAILHVSKPSAHPAG
jgi:hypothetical protein